MNISKLILLFIIFSIDSSAQTVIEESNQYIKTEKLPVLLYFQAGGIMSLGGENFFDAYSEHLGGEKTQFTKTPTIYGGARIILDDKYRLNISAGYFLARLNDYYIQSYDNNFEKGNRRISQSIDLHSIPLVASLEFTPFKQPYRTFLGAGIGVDVGHMNWLETIDPGSSVDRRLGGDWSTGTILSPVLRLSTGINLLFDRKHPEYVLHNFLLELRYNFTYRNQKVFGKLNRQFFNEIDDLNKSYLILPSYLELVVGFSMNFEGS